jgi:hypothetical protein
VKVSLMENSWFDAPVAVSLGRANVAYNVNSVRQAADIVLHKWPIEGGRKHATAMKACKMVMDGTKHAKHARIAFTEAAKEADILVR